LWEIVTARFEQWGEEISTAIKSAAESALAAARQAAAWLDEQIEELEARIRQLVQDIQVAVAAIAGQLRALALNLSGQVGSAIEAVRDWGWNTARAVLFDNVVFKVLPNSLRAEAERLVRNAYYSAFGNATYLLTTPLHAFAQAAGWVQEALTHQIQIGAFDRNAILNYVRERALALGAQQLTLPIAAEIDVPGPFGIHIKKEINLGTISLAPHDILGVVVNTLMSNTLLGSIVDQVIGYQQQLVEKNGQLSASRFAYQGLVDKDEANKALDTIAVLPEI
jgi:hypothetical protein